VNSSPFTSRRSVESRAYRKAAEPASMSMLR
jgi:hypothetical protein